MFSLCTSPPLRNCHMLRPGTLSYPSSILSANQTYLSNSYYTDCSTFTVLIFKLQLFPHNVSIWTSIFQAKVLHVELLSIMAVKSFFIASLIPIMVSWIVLTVFWILIIVLWICFNAFWKRIIGSWKWIIGFWIWIIVFWILAMGAILPTIKSFFLVTTWLLPICLS